MRTCKPRLGYYAWKPLVICKALSQIEPGAMLLFMDANLKKYQESFMSATTWFFQYVMMWSWPSALLLLPFITMTQIVDDHSHHSWNEGSSKTIKKRFFVTIFKRLYRSWIAWPQQDYREGLKDLRKTCCKLLERTDFFVPLEDAMWKRIQIQGFQQKIEGCLFKSCCLFVPSLPLEEKVMSCQVSHICIYLLFIIYVLYCIVFFWPPFFYFYMQFFVGCWPLSHPIEDSVLHSLDLNPFAKEPLQSPYFGTDGCQHLWHCLCSMCQGQVLAASFLFRFQEISGIRWLVWRSETYDWWGRPWLWWLGSLEGLSLHVQQCC